MLPGSSTGTRRPSSSRRRCAAVRTSSSRGLPAPASPPCCAQVASTPARPVRARRGQRRADAGAAGRALRPGPGAVEGLPARRLRRRTAASRRCAPAALLYVEELNRVPEETLNVLLTVMSEGEITVPRLGRVPAAPGFCAGRRDEPVRRRRHRADLLGALRPDLPDRDGLPVRRTPSSRSSPPAAPDPDAEWRDRMVAPGPPHPRAPRHPGRLVGARRDRRGSAWPSSSPACAAYPSRDWQVGLVAAKVALSGRIRLHESSSRTPEEVVDRAVREGLRDRPRPAGGD